MTAKYSKNVICSSLQNLTVISVVSKYFCDIDPGEEIRAENEKYVSFAGTKGIANHVVSDIAGDL
jgi:hypothetical protein